MIALNSSGLKRTGTMRAFASPFGKFGLPTLLGFFIGREVPKLLHDCGSYGFPCRRDRVNMQNRNMPSRIFRAVRLV